uniref:Uncharacterized protein n=1 Tax=Anguilla anguilla TaxID=7936 RepID=A0A0E9PDV8_ANGAN
MQTTPLSWHIGQGFGWSTAKSTTVLTV